MKFTRKTRKFSEVSFEYSETITVSGQQKRGRVFCNRCGKEVLPHATETADETAMSDIDAVTEPKGPDLAHFIKEPVGERLRSPRPHLTKGDAR